MFAVVDFITEKARDGTTPCEIVHLTWISPDLKSCSWPGNSQYSKAFRKGGQPEETWKRCPINVKYMSADLQLTREYRDKLLDGSSSTEISDQNLVKNSSGRRNVLRARADSGDSEDEGVPKRLKKLAGLPAIPDYSFTHLDTSTVCDTDKWIAPTTTLSVTNNLPRTISQQPSVEISTGGNFLQQCNTDHQARQISNLDKSFLRRLERLERKIDDVHEFMRKLKDSVNTLTETPEGAPGLPLQDVPMLDLLEAYLLTSNALKSMVTWLSKTGGSGSKDATERIMGTIFTNSVASKLNWKGVVKKGVVPKIGIKKFPRTVILIKRCVQTIEENTTDKCIEGYIKNWLKHASRRGINKVPSSIPSISEEEN